MGEILDATSKNYLDNVLVVRTVFFTTRHSRFRYCHNNLYHHQTEELLTSQFWSWLEGLAFSGLHCIAWLHPLNLSMMIANTFNDDCRHFWRCLWIRVGDAVLDYVVLFGYALTLTNALLYIFLDFAWSCLIHFDQSKCMNYLSYSQSWIQLCFPNPSSPS